MFLAVFFLTSGLGLVMLLGLFLQARAANRAVNLGRYRSDGPGVNDLLNYAAAIDDGVIIGKNGAFLAAWEFRGEDFSALSDDYQAHAVSHRINQALLPFGSGWMCHADFIRKAVPSYHPASRDHFPDPISAAIDEERRRFFEGRSTVYEGRHVLTVTWRPPSLAARKAGDWMLQDDAPAQTPEQVAEKALDRFRRAIADLETRLGGVLSLRRLKTYKKDGATYDEFLEHLQRCLTGIDQPVRLPKTPIFLDAMLGGQEFFTGTIAKVGKKFIQCVAIEGFPDDSYPGILNALSELPLDYRWSTRWIFLDPWKAVSHLELFRKKWAMMVWPLLCTLLRMQTDNKNKDAEAMAEDATDAKQGVQSGKASAGYYNSVIILMDEDRAAVEEAARQVEKQVRNCGFVPRVETINTVEAFLGTLPGHSAENVRRPLLNTYNLADLLPVSTIWTGRGTCPCPFYPPGSPPLAYALTSGNAAFRVNVHVRDWPHFLIFGPTSMGKSVLMAFLSVSFRRYQGATVFVFDKGMSFYALCKALGGDHYSIAGDGDTLAFCPLQYLDTPSDRAWALQWVELILQLNRCPVTPEQQNQIAKALDLMHARGQRTLTDFWLTVEGKPIRQALAQYCRNGAFARVFDAEQDGLSAFGAYTVFEMQEVFGFDERFRLPILWYLFRRVEKALRGQPAAVFLDEASRALDNDFFRQRIEVWLREMRKANCAVGMATQSLGDAERSGILDLLNESTSTKVFLPNPSAGEPSMADLYARFDLNPQQIELIRGAAPKREYYLVSEEGARPFDLALSPLALAFLGVSDKEAVAEVQRLEALHGPDWVHVWLAAKGLSLRTPRQ